MGLGEEALKVILTAALATGGTLWVGYLFDRKPRAAHLAIRVSTTLERFAIECVDAIWENKAYLDSLGNVGSRASLPKFPDYPTDGAWSLLDKSLAERALTLPNRWWFSAGRIQAAIETNSGPEDADSIAETVCNECGWMGSAAWTLATSYRTRYRLPQVEERTLGADIPGILDPYAIAAAAERAPAPVESS